ncbi:MAG TPA: glycosyltransferase family 9 protein [Verrucomicrobiales bacterium]|nr:glycosyltransferase family 9 protein [Verrucomicrobiales bacterium]
MGSILVIRGGAIGDFLLTLPALHLLRRSLPGNRFALLGYPGITAVAAEAGWADETRSIDYAALSRFFVPGAELPESLTSWLAEFDLVVSYLYDPDQFFENNLRRAGVASLIPISPKIREGAGHASEQLAAPLSQLALFLGPQDHTFTLEFRDSLRSQADALLPPGFSPETCIAVHPGSGSPAKNWPFENWLTLLSRLPAGRLAPRILVITGEAEMEQTAYWVARLREMGAPFHHLESPPLPVLGEILGRCRLFLGHDSGIGHLAAAAGAPCLLLFGPTEPETWAPRRPGIHVLRHPSGAPGRISVEDVRSAVHDLLSP